MAETLLSVRELVKDFPAVTRRRPAGKPGRSREIAGAASSGQGLGPDGPGAAEGRDGAGTALRVLDGVSFDLAAGETVAVTGPSGSGKSTLLNVIGTLDAPTSGEVLFRGEPIHGFGPGRAASFRNKEMGFVFQDHHLLPQCTALENVLVPVLAAGRVTDGDERRAADLLAAVGLDGRAGHFPAELSGGERQRVALARALVNGPGLILADEPTGNLDAEAARSAARLLLEMRDRSGAAVVVVTHNEELAGTFGRRASLREGKLVE